MKPSCKGCKFWNATDRKCPLTRAARNAWDCCPSHDPKAQQSLLHKGEGGQGPDEGETLV